MRASIVLTVLAAAAPASSGPRGHGTVIPQVAAEIRCDGELDELAWRSPARTGQFTDASGALAAPYSDARFLRDDRFLYLALYAADEDIRSTDEFVVELRSSRGRRTLHFSASGSAPDAPATTRAAVDTDGSIDRPSDDDEEWIVEAAVPLDAIPFDATGSVVASISRCDVTRDHGKRCGSWHGTLVRR